MTGFGSQISLLLSSYGLFDQFFKKTEGGGEEVETIETSLPFEEVNSVIVKNINGMVRIAVWEEPEIHVKAVKKVKYKDEDRGKEYAKNLKISVDKLEDRIEIITKHPKGNTPKHIRSISVEYDIKMPQKSGLDASTLNGNISIDGIWGSLKATTLNGSLTLYNVQGQVFAKTTNGNINSKIPLLDGASEFQTVNGSIEVSASEARPAPIKAQTVNGSISIKIPSGFSANLDASVANGSINCDIPISVQGKLEKRSLKGKLNNGGEELKLNTVNGNINVKI